MPRKASNELLPPLLDAVGGQVGGEHRQRGDFPLALFVQMTRLVRALLLEQDGFGVDDLAHQRAAVRAVDDVGFEERQPSAEAMQQGVALGARRSRAHRGELVAGLRQLGRIADEFLVGALGAHEAGLVVAGGHVGRPEQILLGLVDGDVGVVQVVEVLACVLHDFWSVSGAPARSQAPVLP